MHVQDSKFIEEFYKKYKVQGNSNLNDYFYHCLKHILGAPLWAGKYVKMYNKYIKN